MTHKIMRVVVKQGSLSQLSGSGLAKQSER